jgi:hypothetical protein
VSGSAPADETTLPPSLLQPHPDIQEASAMKGTPRGGMVSVLSRLIGSVILLPRILSSWHTTHTAFPAVHFPPQNHHDYKPVRYIGISYVLQY